jgi:hypothetical protein
MKVWKVCIIQGMHSMLDSRQETTSSSSIIMWVGDLPLENGKRKVNLHTFA